MGLRKFFPRIYKSSAKNNVLINTLQIGLTKTKMNLIDKKKNLKKRVNLIPLRRMAKPSEVANYIYFLLSENNTLISNFGELSKNKLENKYIKIIDNETIIAGKVTSVAILVARVKLILKR